MTEQVLDLPIEKVLDSSVPNYRKHLGPLEQMADSMKDAGVLEPLVVRMRGKLYELVFGYKRRAAAKKAGLPTVPCIVRAYTDEQVLTVRIIENSQREDAHPMDEARGFEVLVERGLDVAGIGEKIGRPASYVAQRLQLLKLGKEGRAALDDDEITLAVAQLLARIPAKLQAEALEELSDHDYSGKPMKFEDARKYLEEHFLLRLDQAPFDITDAKLLPKAGACSACPKRTGNQRELFPDVKSPDLCTDPVCHREKRDAVWKLRVKDAQAGGTPVLEGDEAQKAFRYGSAFKKLTDSEWVGGKQKTVKQLLGKEKPPVTLVRDDDGNIHELVRVADVAKVVKELRPEKDAYDPRSGRYKSQEAKEKRRKEAVGLAIAVAVQKAEKLAPGDVLDLVVRAFAARAWNEVQKAMLTRRGVKPKAGGIEAQLLKIVKDFKTTGELNAFGVELALRSGQLGYGASNEIWGDAMKLCELDFADFEKLVASQHKTKAAAKKNKAKAALATKPAKAKKKSTPGVCRGCGCTNVEPCVDDDGEPCSWVEPDLCSACSGAQPKKRRKRKAKP